MFIMQFSTFALVPFFFNLSILFGAAIGWDKQIFAYKEQCIQGVADPNSTTLPSSFGMLLFPSFEIIDVFGPLEALKIVSYHYQIDLALIAATIDPVSTKPRFPMGNSTFDPQVVPTHTLETAPELDVLFVPGGGGTRAPDSEINGFLRYLRATYPRLQYIVTVCTGSLLAGRAALLDGKRATTNKAALSSVAARVPKAKWQVHARWVVDGNIWTSSGLSAGIDVTLEFIECIYGDAMAARISRSMEYERHTDPRWDPFAKTPDPFQAGWTEAGDRGEQQVLGSHTELEESFGAGLRIETSGDGRLGCAPI